MKKLFAIISLTSLMLLSAVFDAQAATDPVQQKLELELEKMISAGHLRPGYFLCVEFYITDTKNIVFDFGHHYFHNPADTIYTLCRALPLVEDSNAVLYQDLRNYIQSEWAAFPPTQYTHVGWNSGAGREGTKMPAEVLTSLRATSAVGQGPALTASVGFPGWSFNPFNFYACWQYASEFGGAASIYSTVQSKVEHYPADTVLQQMPHVLNSYIAGYIGYLKLEELAGQPKSTTVETWLNELKTKILTNLQTHPRNIRATEAGGFLWLVPELGDYLYENAESTVRQRVEQHSLLCPYWMQAWAGETTRYTGGTKMAEGTMSHLYEYSSLFQAKALALKETRDELELDLDSPRFYRGDLYYIQNIIATLEAPAAPGASIKAATGCATVTSVFTGDPEDPCDPYLDDCQTAGRAAAQMALDKLGALPEGVAPKVVLVYTSEDILGPWYSRQRMLDGVAEVFDANIIFGSQSYQAISEDDNLCSCSVMVIAGNDDDIQVHASTRTVGTFPNETNIPPVINQICQDLMPYAYPADKEKLLLIFGMLHTPNQEYAVEAAKAAFDVNYPIIGNSAVPNTQGDARVFYQGQIQTFFSMLGVLITGNFSLDFDFQSSTLSAQPIIDSGVLAFTNALGSSGASTVCIFDYDCGSRRSPLVTAGRMDDYLDALNGVTGGTIPFAGFHGGGEIGRDWGTNESYGDKQHISVCTLKTQVTSQGPVAIFATTENYLGVDFDASASSAGDSPIVSYDWDFGDGNTASGVTTSHTYAAEGSYVVILTVTDSDTNTDTAQKTLNLSLPVVSSIGDLDNNGMVDFRDYAKLAQYWLTGELTVDIVTSGTIDYADLAVMTDYWMYGVPIPHEGPTAWYKFDGDTLDSSGFGHTGTIAGNPTWATGQDGTPTGALDFDGSGDVVNCGSFDPSGTTGLLTVAAWVKWDGLVTGLDQMVAAKRTAWGTDMMWQITIKNATGNIQIASGNSPSDTSVAEFAASITAGAWTHLAITYDGTEATLYINGVSPVDPAPFEMGLGTSATVSIGAAYQGTSPTPTAFAGVLDDVRLYDRPLSSAEIQSLMSTGFTQQDVDLLDDLISDYPSCYVASSDVNFNPRFDVSSCQWGVPDNWLGPEDVAYINDSIR